MDHTDTQTLIIRADAGTEMGTGHLMRCLALAQAWKDAGGSAVFVTACRNERLLQRLRDEGFDTHLLDRTHPDAVDWGATESILTSCPGAWVVLDGYHFDDAYQAQVKDAGHRLLVIDDMAHLKHYHADILLNQNLHAEQLHYSCEPYTRLLLGTRYVLLRREFLAWKDWKREIPQMAKRVLVTLGGGDPDNHTLKVIQALQAVDIPGLEATVVIGASNPHLEILQAAISKNRVPIRLLHNAENMPELMAWADVAVSAAGSTVWELMMMRLPAIILCVADNQARIAESAAATGNAVQVSATPSTWSYEIALSLKRLIVEAETRSKLSNRGRCLVDGAGTGRAIQAVQCMEQLEAYQR